MADNKEIMMKTIILEDSDDYPRWAKEVTSLLMVNDCIDAIKPEVILTHKSIIAQYVAAGLNERDVTNTDIKASIKDESKDSRKRRVKAAGLIQSRVGQRHHQFIANMTAEDMWIMLKEKLQDTTPMSQMEVILKASDIKMSSYTDPALYCAEFNQIQKGWKVGSTTMTGNTNLTEACHDIIRYKATQHVSKALITITKGKKLAKGPCTTKKCIEAKQTRHLPDACWIKYPHLKPADTKT